MDIQQDIVQEAIDEAGVIPPGQNSVQDQGHVQGNVQYVILDNISAIVKDPVGGVKDYIDNALSYTKSQVLESARVSAKSASSFKFKGNRIQFEFNVKIKEKVDSALLKIEKGDTAMATSELKAALDDIKVRNKHVKLAVKGVLHLWALFLKTSCIFSKK